MINEYLHNLSVVDKSFRDLHRTQRLERKHPENITRTLYKLPNELEIISRAMFGFEEGDVIRVRLSGYGGLTAEYVVQEHNAEGLSIHSLKWDNASNDWLEIRSIKLTDVLLFVGHAFDIEKAKKTL